MNPVRCARGALGDESFDIDVGLEKKKIHDESCASGLLAFDSRSQRRFSILSTFTISQSCRVGLVSFRSGRESVRRRCVSFLPSTDSLLVLFFVRAASAGLLGLGGVILGTLLGSHLTLGIVSTIYEWDLLLQWSLYVVCLATFHLMEFFTTALFNPESATYDSYLINHSVAYTVAALMSWTEFWIVYVVSERFDLQYLSIPRNLAVPCGLGLVVFGQCMRSVAMWTAKHNFNHIVQERRKSNHRLVTAGVYRIFRHPSYVGFFYWSIGTQVLLGNPFCAVAYAIASWSFFNKRIPNEERYLCETIFPKEYPAYMRRTFVGIPWIRGYDPVDKRKETPQ